MSTITTEDSKSGCNDLTGLQRSIWTIILFGSKCSESIQHQRNEVTMKDLIIRGNLIQNLENYDTLRLTKFAI